MVRFFKSSSVPFKYPKNVNFLGRIATQDVIYSHFGVNLLKEVKVKYHPFIV
jgi:hypothetical protein